jgi:hypothetical protein
VSGRQQQPIAGTISEPPDCRHGVKRHHIQRTPEDQGTANGGAFADHERWLDFRELCRRQQRQIPRRHLPTRDRAGALVSEPAPIHRRAAGTIDRLARDASSRDRADVGERTPPPIMLHEKGEQLVRCEPPVGGPRQRRLQHGLECPGIRDRIQVDEPARYGRRERSRAEDPVIGREDQQHRDDRRRGQGEIGSVQAPAPMLDASGIARGCGRVGYGHVFGWEPSSSFGTACARSLSSS